MPLNEDLLARLMVPGGEIDQSLGIEAPQFAEYDPEEEFQASPFERFLERFAAGGLPLRRPRGFGANLLAGFAGGLGGAGSRVAGARQKFEARQEQRRKEADVQRIKATEEYRKERGTALRELSKSQRDERRQTQEYERDNPLVTPELKERYPAIARIPEGERLDSETWRKVKQSMLPEGPGEVGARVAAERAALNVQRQTDAAERQERLARVQTVNQLASAYKEDRSIKGYEAVRSNLNTAETGAKEKSGPGDIALIFSFMRALEPENVNVVREGEFTNARQAAGALQRTAALPARFFKGSQLTDDGRQYFLLQMLNSL